MKIRLENCHVSLATLLAEYLNVDEKFSFHSGALDFSVEKTMMNRSGEVKLSDGGHIRYASSYFLRVNNHLFFIHLTSDLFSSSHRCIRWQQKIH